MNQTKNQIKNCRQAIRMLRTVPEHNLDLDRFRRGDKTTPVHCGSVACIGGWLPYWPYFAELGVRASDFGSPIMDGIKTSSALSRKLFGVQHMFGTRGAILGEYGSTETDKKIAIARFRKRLKTLERK